MINRNVDARSLKIDQRELASRLGQPYGASVDTYRGLYEELLLAAKPSYVAMRVKLNRENGGITVGKMTSHSTALGKLTDGCDFMMILVATLGIGVDRLLLKKAHTSALEAFIIDALADALVEALCDLAEKESCEGFLATPRFSPGYADLELSLGAEIIALCGADKTLGIKMSQSGLMIPKKSVNALVAIRNA